MLLFRIKDGEFFVLLGPTGAGKTTTLRIIAGLTKQDAGSLFFDGNRWSTLTPADRDVAYRLPAIFPVPNDDCLRQPGLPVAFSFATNA